MRNSRDDRSNRNSRSNNRNSRGGRNQKQEANYYEVFQMFVSELDSDTLKLELMVSSKADDTFTRDEFLTVMGELWDNRNSKDKECLKKITGKAWYKGERWADYSGNLRFTDLGFQGGVSSWEVVQEVLEEAEEEKPKAKAKKNTKRTKYVAPEPEDEEDYEDDDLPFEDNEEDDIV
jgi:hypothetical protein